MSAKIINIGFRSGSFKAACCANKSLLFQKNVQLMNQVFYGPLKRLM